MLAVSDRLKAAIQAGALNSELLLAAWKALSQQTARVEALVELVFAERDLPLNIEPNYEDPRYTEKHERARLAREAANMPLPSVAALAAEQKEKS